MATLLSLMCSTGILIVHINFCEHFVIKLLFALISFKHFFIAYKICILIYVTYVLIKVIN